MSELKGPGNIEIRQFITNKTAIELYTVNNKTYKGTINWADTNAFQLILEDGSRLTVLIHAIVGYKQA